MQVIKGKETIKYVFPAKEIRVFLPEGRTPNWEIVIKGHDIKIPKWVCDIINIPLLGIVYILRGLRWLYSRT